MVTRQILQLPEEKIQTGQFFLFSRLPFFFILTLVIIGLIQIMSMDIQKIKTSFFGPIIAVLKSIQTPQGKGFKLFLPTFASVKRVQR